MKDYYKLQNNGFTLVETLVAIGIFSLVISVAVGTFVGGSSSQKKIMELSGTQREAGYLMETVSRELRMATAISNVDDAIYNDQQDNQSSIVEFTNYDGDLVRYCRSDENGGCDALGKFFSREVCMTNALPSVPNNCDITLNQEIINSSDIEITDLTFYTSEDFNGPPKIQPVITIVMKVKSTGQYGTEFTLQNSIALRLYE